MHPSLQSVMSVAGWEKQVPAMVAVFFVYLSVLLFCWLIYKCNEIILPKSLLGYGQDFIKTTAYCAYPFGHGILRKYYGNIGYVFFAAPMLTLTQFVLPMGDASPLAGLVKFIRNQISAQKFVVKTCIHILAGLAAFRLGIAIYHFDLHEHYSNRILNFNKGHCTSDLRVLDYLGALTELCGVCLDSVVRSYVLSKRVRLDALFKYYVTTSLVCIGFPLTGMFMNPVMATGLTFGCGTTGLVSHCLVYWVGPFVGVYIAQIIISSLHDKHVKKRE